MPSPESESTESILLDYRLFVTSTQMTRKIMFFTGTGAMDAYRTAFSLKHCRLTNSTIWWPIQYEHVTISGALKGAHLVSSGLHCHCCTHLQNCYVQISAPQSRVRVLSGLRRNTSWMRVTNLSSSALAGCFNRNAAPVSRKMSHLARI